MKLNPPIVKFSNRYSSTNEPDEMGRWAIVAYAGRFNGTAKIGFYKRKICRWEIAWIKKLSKNKYCIHFKFPNNTETVFNTIPECKTAIKQAFTHFVKTVLAENN